MKLTKILGWSIPVVAVGVYALYKIGKEDRDERFLEVIRELYQEAVG